MPNMARIIAIVCALCAPGTAIADCQTDVADAASKGMRHVHVYENASGARRSGDVTFSFQDRAPITMNANDPEPKLKTGMTGAEAREGLFQMYLHKKARIHHNLCRAGVKK